MPRNILVATVKVAQPVVGSTNKSQKRYAQPSTYDAQTINSELDFIHERINGVITEATAIANGTATVVARTNPVGTANGAYESIGNTTLVDQSAAIMNNTKEADVVLNQLIADNLSLRTKLNTILGVLRDAGLLKT